MIQKDFKIKNGGEQHNLPYYPDTKKDPMPNLQPFVNSKIFYMLETGTSTIWDKSQNRNHGSLTNGHWNNDISRWGGKYLNFDGNDYIDTNFQPATEDLEDFTMIFMFKSNDATANQTIAGYQNAGGQVSYLTALIKSGGGANEWRSLWRDPTANKRHEIQVDEDTILDNIWKQLSWVERIESNDGDFYINGTIHALAAETSETPTVEAADVNLFIGAFNQAGGGQIEFLKANLDLFIFIRGRLSANQMISLKNLGEICD